MTEVMRFAMDDGTEEEVPRSEVGDFQKLATEHDEHPDQLQQLRVTDKNGRAEDIIVPSSEMEDFKAAAGEHGDTFTPLRTVEMANGTRKTMTVGELSKFLRSKEYLESDDHKASVEQQRQQGLEQGSVGLAGTIGAVEGLVKGGWYGGNAVANKIAKAIPEVGIEIERAIGNLTQGAGKVTGSETVHDVGDWLVRDATDAKAWLDKNLPSETSEWSGYSDWSTKVADKIGEVAAMAYKFAPGLAPKTGGTALEQALAGGNNKLMETIFASDGVNAYANTYDTAVENGATPTQAAAEGGAAFLINYFGQKAMIKAGGLVEGVKNPALRFAGGAAATGNAMGVLGAENKALQNIAENKPVGEGVVDAFEEGNVEGVLFHSMNAVPGMVMGAMKSRADRKMNDEIARTEILEALKTPEGSAALAGLMDKEAGDAAIAARKALARTETGYATSGREDVRRLAIEAGLPETMTTAEMYRVLDAVAQQRQALAERVRTQMNDEQADALAQAVEAEIVKGVEPGQPAPVGKEAEELFQRTWLRAVEKVQDAAVLDDPETRKQIVETARKQATSEIRNEREAMTQELSRIRGASLGDQLAEFEKRGIATWEDAEADGLISRDERGRWSGGARQALNIEINGTDKMKDAVKEGKLDGDLAEELITASYMELGGRPPEERAEMIDRIIDQADGNAAEARRLLALARTEAGDATSGRESGRLPETAYEGAVNAERMKGTELKTIDGGVMGVQRFPEVMVEISAEGIKVEGLTDELMSKPENAADVAALLTRLNDIAERNNLTVDLGDANAKAIADGMIDEITRGGLEAAQRKMDTRARLFKVLADTTLGNGTTFDEQSFRNALAETGNGRRWVDNHGNIYGFVDDKGVIHFNPAKFSMNTPIHEYGHVALEAVKRINPKLWEKGMELIEGTAYLDEIERYSKTDGHEYSYLRGNREAMKDEALATMIGDRGEKLVIERGLEAELKKWIKEIWKAFKEAFGVADLTDEQIERMSIDDFVNVMNAELLRGREFGLKNRRNSTLNRKPLTKARSFEQHYQLQEEQEAAAEAERWASSGMNAKDYILSRVEEGEPAFDLDWETAREIARDRAQGRFSIGGLYTGSAADYEKPSLLKVGTGEGSQVYGWGLYASDRRGVAEGYANSERIKNANNNTNKIYAEVDKILRNKVKSQQQIDDIYEALDTTERWDDVKTNLIEGSFDEGSFDVFIKHEKEFKKIHDELVAHRNLYEQTFFTNRAPGDESHLLKWYEPVSEENWKRIKDQAEKEGISVDIGTDDTGSTVYKKLKYVFGGKNIFKRGEAEKAASEFLARADIDGIKYPVDSYGKTVKDGDEVGWNYVSFRDDNIRVDHKWRDGQAVFSAGRDNQTETPEFNPEQIKSATDNRGTFDPLNPDIRFQAGQGPRLNKSRFIAGRARIAANAEMNERTPGAIAASRELNTWRTRPVSQLGAQRYMSLPISDLEQLRKAVTGQTLPAIVMKNMASGRLASHTRDGQLLIAADVFGTVDKADMEAEKTTLKAHGFFRNEDPNWCARQLPGDILREQRRSEDQLATQLLQLGSRRARGQASGGQEGARGVFADEVATIILEQPRQYGGVLGRIQTLGKGVKNAARQILGSDDRAKQEAGAFLDWAYGGQLTDPATGNPIGRADALTLDQLTSSMFGKWLVMPMEVEVRAPGWSQVFESTIANDQKLADAFRTLGDQHLQKNDYILKKLKEQQSLETEKALAKVWWEGTEPIKAGGRLAQAKENLLVGFHDKFSPVYIRVDESVKDIVKAKRATLRAATSATDRARIRAEIERFEGDIAKKMNRLELSRTAYERGSWNEGRLYLMEMTRLENDAYEKWGLSGEDRSLYLEQQRVIETQGRASSFGEDVRTAQMVLDEMKQRLGPAKWSKMEEYGRRFFDIHEREVIDDPRLETMFGKPFADYFRTQQHYVTTKRVFSKEELDAIETERELARQNGVAGGDDVVSQMYAYAGAKGAGEVTGEKEWTAKLAGSFAAKQEVRSATYAKVDRLMQALRRNQFVIDLKDALLEAKVEGVRDMVRTDSAKYPTGDRYGHLNYMVGGQKRVLIVPRQIAEAFKTDADGAKWITNSNNLIRSFLIDYNPAYWLMNIRRNQDSIEKNLPGMRETYLKTGARAVSPGLGALSDLFLQAIVRKIPAAAKLFSDKTIFAYIPKAERYAKIVEDPSKWQQEFWKAEADGDLAKVQQMNEDWLGVREMLKSNMLVPAKAAYRGGDTQGFAFDAMNAKGLKTLEQIDQQNRTKSGLRKFVEAANFLKKNQAQQEHEDILAKTIGYLAMRTHYGLTQSSAESGLAVKKNVSIAEGERSGRLKRPVQQFMAQFFNMVEKGVVRHWKDWQERPGEMAIKDGKVWAGRLASMMFGTGMVVKWMLDDADGDEKKARAKFGKAFDYAKAYREAYLNCSEYVKENYNITPVWTDGFTSVIIGGGLTDEDKLITPSADFIAKYLAYAKGIGEKPSLGSAIADSTFKAVTPDLQLASPFVNFLRTTVEATMIDNPTDYFRNAPMYDQKLWELRNENWQKRGEFAAAVGRKLWNDFGGRSVLAADVNGVDNGRGTAPETLETVLKRIPWASPMINRMVKVQVGSPAKRGAVITAEQKRRSDVVSLCAAELLKLSEEKVPYNEKDPNGYQAKLNGWKQQYNLSDWDMANLKMKFFNGFMQRANREAFDRQALQKMKAEARRMGFSEDQMWVILGGM